MGLVVGLGVDRSVAVETAAGGRAAGVMAVVDTVVGVRAVGPLGGERAAAERQVVA